MHIRQLPKNTYEAVKIICQNYLEFFEEYEPGETLRIHFWSCRLDAVRILGRNMQIISSLFNEIESWALRLLKDRRSGLFYCKFYSFERGSLLLEIQFRISGSSLQKILIKVRKGFIYNIPEIIVTHHSIADHSWDQTWFVLVFWLWQYSTLC